MATIKIAVNGKPAFTWEGDETAVKRILESFPDGARHVGMTAKGLADQCLQHFRTGSLISSDLVGQEMQMMGVLWSVLEMESDNTEHPGKIGDYAGVVDFMIDLAPTDGGVKAHVLATSEFNG